MVLAFELGALADKHSRGFNPPSAIQYFPSWHPAIMGPPKEFTITVSGHVFVLTEDQIHRDAPNYFTGLFEGSFKEAREGVQELKLHRDPYLFTFIHMHLCGYEVLPLPKGNIPSHLSEGSRLKNLILDARFYGLDSLAQELEAEITPEKKSNLGNCRCARGWAWRL